MKYFVGSVCGLYICICCEDSDYVYKMYVGYVFVF